MSTSAPTTPPIDRSRLHFGAHSFTGQAPGVRLIVTGGVHGNEVCGPVAIRRVLADIEAGRVQISAGSVTFVPVTNPLAYALGQRTGDRNLNRNLSPTATPQDFEDRIANWLCPLLAAHDVLLDLHSTHAQNPAFAMLGPRDNAGPLQPFAHERAERALAAHLGVARFVDGWLEVYASGVKRRQARVAASTDPRAVALNHDVRYGVGTTEAMRAAGGYAITLECGQHTDPASPEVAYRAILNSLVHLGLVVPCEAAPQPEPVTAYEALSMVDVTDRLHEGDQFAQVWSSFNELKAGTLIGTRHDGRLVHAPADGRILFPDAKATPGNEWFYWTQNVASI